MDINLYKVRKEINIEEACEFLVNLNYYRQDQRISDNIEALLFVECSDRNTPPWQIFLQNTFEFESIDLGLQINSILLFKKSNSLYIIPFGRSYSKILDIIDFEFGMNFAEKQIMNEKIKGKKIDYYLQNKVRELTTFGSNWIESPLPNQSYSEVTGGVKNPEIFGNNVTCSDKVKFTLNYPLNNELLNKIFTIISHTDEILRSPHTNTSIPRIKSIKKDKDSEDLYSHLYDLIQHNSKDVTIKFVGINEFYNYNELYNLEQITFYYNKVKKANAFYITSVDDLIDILRQKKYDLRNVKIQITYENGDKEIFPVWRILDISITYKNNIYIHTKNKWYYLNDSFIELLEAQLKEIAIEIPQINITEDAMSNEDKFIDNVVENNSGWIKLHKKFIKGNISTKVELADLYNSNKKELFIVKMGLETSDTIYSLQQAILSLSMLNDKENYDFSEITNQLYTHNDLNSCNKYSILWPLTSKKNRNKISQII
ncbi:DUF6119 family protein [Staphylococcus gallinarum]|uniref:DUF6119 family protein n=1 Tax=Staphylococcus gallinarum TaxID=1293 RepID=UPI0030C03264